MSASATQGGQIWLAHSAILALQAAYITLVVHHRRATNELSHTVPIITSTITHAQPLSSL